MFHQNIVPSKIYTYKYIIIHYCNNNIKFKLIIILDIHDNIITMYDL